MIKYLCAIAVLTTTMAYASTDPALARINKDVRHELVMLPYLDVFDNLTYQVDGSTVTLAGQVTRSTLKTDAEHDWKCAFHHHSECFEDSIFYFYRR